MKNLKYMLCAAALSTMIAVPALAENDSADIAKQLANPLASMISIPMQLNYDQNIGPREKGHAWQLNIQPVIPFALNENWYAVSRTILPFIDQHDVPFRGRGKTGMGDIIQSVFFTPAKVPESGWVIGAGPVALLPTATENELGANQWALGPTAVALKQDGPWTYGILANHLWSVGSNEGDDSIRASYSEINATYIEPWVSYVTEGLTTISLSAETTHDWEGDHKSFPLNFTVDQLFQVGDNFLSIGGALKYWVESPDGAPQDFGFRLQATYVLPR